MELLEDFEKNDPVEISVVSPVYNSDSLVLRLVDEIRDALKSSNYEIILVDDGSPDTSWSRIQEAGERFPEVRGVLLSRNFGQHYAISAGLHLSRGNQVVVMDCDLQDRPSEIPRLLAKAKEGFEIVQARRTVRRDSFLKKTSSSCFHRLLEYLTGNPQDPSIANFGVYGRKAVNAINKLPETIRYFPTMVRWVGFKKTTINVEHQKRPAGKTSYSLFALIKLALDICLANSDKPLRLVIMTGFMISGVGFMFALYVIWQAFQGEIQVLGYASLMVSMWCLSGLTMLIMGVVGLYVGKSFEGIKGRPPFIIASTVNFNRPTKKGPAH